MTPHQKELTKDWLKPIGRRHFDYQLEWMGKAIINAKAFEITEIMPLVEDMMLDYYVDGGKKINKSGEKIALETLFFLPAQFTWIEWKFCAMQRTVDAIKDMDDPELLSGIAQMRLGFLLFKEEQSDRIIVCTSPIAGKQSFGVVGTFDGLNFEGQPKITTIYNDDDNRDGETSTLIARMMLALSVINSPDLLHRREHKPSGLLRDSIKSKTARSRTPFQLLPWTEIVLSINKRHEDGTTSREVVSGEKCRHYCRAHLRLWQGRLIHVKGHWRGNAELGIAQSTYRASL